MAKKLLLATVLCVLGMIALAQSTDNFNYQAVIRNSEGDILSNQTLDLFFSITSDVDGTNVIYKEQHSNVQTTEYGVVNLIVGNGTPSQGTFSEIDWTQNLIFLKVELDLGSGIINLGTKQLYSVPFANYSVESNHAFSSVTSETATNAINAENAITAQSLGAKVYSTSTDTLFVVKDNLGNPVFMVFPDGAHVIVNESAKGAIGGFAVSGRTSGKAPLYNNYLTVTPDSTRIRFKQSAKGAIGGFAVSGRTSGKVNDVSLINLFPDNYFIGHESGLNVTGAYNSFFGYNAGFNNTTGSRNIFIGYQSGYSNTGSFNNLFFGNRAGYNTTSGGNFNIFLGNEAGFSNTTGDNNTFLGYQSGYLNQEGFYNVYIGYQAGYISGVDGIYKNYRNIFIGPFAGYHSSGVSESVYIGYDAGRFNQNGARNTFVGGNAGENNTVGYDNSFFGNAAGEFTKGIGNTYIGSAAGYSDTASYRNTFLGARTGWAMVTKSYRNTFLGAWAGRDKTGGSYNTFIGFGTGQNGGEGQSNIFIGYNAGYNEQGSYKLYIDVNDTDNPLIYGNFLHDSVIINGDFHVTGNITATGTIIPDYVFEDSYNLESIEEHAEYMWRKKHLPALRSAKEIEQTGGVINMNERREQMLEELEKAHIYIEQLNTRINELEKQNTELLELKDEVDELKKLIQDIKN